MQNLYELPDNFIVSIVADGAKKTKINNENFVYLAENTKYQIRIDNKINLKTDVKVYINDVYIGIWRIEPFSTLFIQRPISVNKKFVFDKYLKQNEVIKVYFYPHDQKLVNWCTPSFYGDLIEQNNNKNNNKCHSIFSDSPNSKKFSMVSPLININKISLWKIITVKIILDNDRYSSFISMNEEDSRELDDYKLSKKEINSRPISRFYDDFYYMDRIYPYD